VIIDFSKHGGQDIILTNDAPTQLGLASAWIVVLGDLLGVIAAGADLQQQK